MNTAQDLNLVADDLVQADLDEGIDDDLRGRLIAVEYAGMVLRAAAEQEFVGVHIQLAVEDGLTPDIDVLHGVLARPRGRFCTSGALTERLA